MARGMHACATMHCFLRSDSLAVLQCACGKYVCPENWIAYSRGFCAVGLSVEGWLKPWDKFILDKQANMIVRFAAT